MIDTQTIEAIHAHLDKHPTDWQARRELADLLEDVGREDESKLQLWLVEWKRAPQHYPKWVTIPNDKPWYWWGGSDPDNHANMGMLVTELLPKSYANGGYSTRRDAETELLRTLIILDWPAPDISTQEVTC